MTDGPNGQQAVGADERVPGATEGPMAEQAQEGSRANQGTTQPKRSVVARLRRFFWMDERVAQAREKSYGPGHPGWEEYEFARALMADADQLGEPAEGKTSALLLYRSAAALMVRARLLRAAIDPGPEASTSECWARLSAHPSVAPTLALTTPDERSLIDSGFADAADGQWVKLPRAGRARAATALRKLAQNLAAAIQLDSRHLRNTLLIRWARIATALLVVALGMRFAARGEGHNLALHRPVTVVTSHPSFGRDPSALVDGDRQNLGFHTVQGANQQVTIDLGSVERLSRVVVYNRFDCCAERAVPLRLEASTDGKSFQLVEERGEPFDHWKVELPGTKARYVRLTNLRADFFHLSEVEVY
jgi:hypothetical protein